MCRITGASPSICRIPTADDWREVQSSVGRTPLTGRPSRSAAIFARAISADELEPVVGGEERDTAGTRHAYGDFVIEAP